PAGTPRNAGRLRQPGWRARGLARARAIAVPYVRDRFSRAAAARRRLSCRCPSAPGRAHRGRRAMAEWCAPGWAMAFRSPLSPALSVTRRAGRVRRIAEDFQCWKRCQAWRESQVGVGPTRIPAFRGHSAVARVAGLFFLVLHALPGNPALLLWKK